MILISHRGNTNGPDPELENKPSHIEWVIEQGYDVEIDVNYLNGLIFLGHDEPQYEVSIEWLIEHKDKLWCHAKDILIFSMLIDLGMNTFMHDVDDAVLTSKGHIWVYPGKKLVPDAICVLPEWSNQNVPDYCGGVCSDFVEDF